MNRQAHLAFEVAARANKWKASESSPTVPGGLSQADEAIAQPYRRMLKLGTPRIAVEQKMAAEGLDSKIVEAVMAGGGPQPTAADVSVPIPTRKAVKISSLSFQEEQRAAPYRKMVKLGMPEGAVRHKMTADSLPTRIQESVLAGEVPASEANSNNTVSGAPTTPNKKAPSNISSLSSEEEAIAANYRKMVKLGLPEGAIRHKMEADGVSQKIAESVIAGETQPEAEEVMMEATPSTVEPSPKPKQQQKPKPAKKWATVVTPSEQPPKSQVPVPDAYDPLRDNPMIPEAVPPTPETKKEPILLDEPTSGKKVTRRIVGDYEEVEVEENGRRHRTRKKIKKKESKSVWDDGSVSSEVDHHCSCVIL